ncbi:EscU/YscU/HrcU family type III secretion system export apparatus switch protein [bacterium]|nr:EscU/YscU/HrcU family type III secretion system export apparatus switch protein [bacterium]
MTAGEDANKRAVALRYETEQDEAPIVVASGRGLTAEKILELADAHGVAVHHDPLLVESLSVLELGEAIPAELYPVVAEVLVFVQRMNREKGEAKR